MNLLEKLCEELGVEVEKEWIGNDGKMYSVTEERIIEYYEPEEYRDTDYEGWVVSEDSVYADILQGKLKPVWEPSVGEWYFVPDITMWVNSMPYGRYVWRNSPYERELLEKGLVFNTEEETRAAVNKMLSALKEG